MSHADKELYEFADFRLDVEERLLLKEGERVPLPDKAFEILCLLIRENNHLVGKNELLEKAWAGAFVEENNLDKNISSLRQALGEKKGKQKFIETVRGRGYRFVAEVRRIETEDEAKAAQENIKPTSSTAKHQPVESNQQIEYPRHEHIGNVIAQPQGRREGVTADLTNQINGASPEINPAKKPEQSVNVEADHYPTESLKTEQAETFKPEIAHSQSKKSRGGVRAMAGLLVVAALAGIIYLMYLYLTPSPIRFQAGNMTRLTATGKIKHAAVSPDGKFVAYVQEESEEKHGLWLRHLASESNVNITPAPKTRFDDINFSPDNNRIYYIANNVLYQMPVLGGMPRKILDKISAGQLTGGISFSPDGKQFAFLRQSQISETATEGSIVIADANGTNEQTLFASQTAVASPYLRGSPTWSPDGKTIIAPIFESEVYNVLAVNVADKSAVKILPNGWDHVKQVAWLPDSKSFLIIGRFDGSELMLHQVWQISYPGGEAQRVNADFNNYTSVSLTADARFLAATRTERVAHIWMMPSDDASRIKQLTGGFERFDFLGSLEWMPVGRIIYGSLLDGKPLILVMNADGSNSKKLMSGVITAAVSPDGRFLAYQKGSFRNGDIGLYRLDLNEMSELRLTNGTDIFPAFSPDGKWVVFKRFGYQKAPILRVGIEGGEPELITDNSSLNYPAISLDGKIVALANRSTNNLVLLPFEGGKPIKMFDVKFQPYTVASKSALQWTPDGRAINYLVLKDKVSNIWRQTIDGGDPQQVTDFKDGLVFGFAFSPDGSQLVLSRGTINSDVVLIDNQK